MSEIVLGALSSAFFLVRIIKGPWMRNPQYVAAATIGAVALSLALLKLAPDVENNFLTGGLAGAAGAWVGIVLFDYLQEPSDL